LYPGLQGRPDLVIGGEREKLYKVLVQAGKRLDWILARRSRILPPALLAASFTFLLVWSWRRWPDILIDFGRELYIPWQIGSGKVLYRDIEHIFGPLSSYFHAALFKLFGASLLVLSVSNACLLAGCLGLLYAFVGRFADRMAAWVSCAFVIFVLAFSQYIYLSNYNFISPYSHEATHGVILSVILIYQLSNHLRQGRRLSLVYAGLAFGLVFLTKTEIFAADVAAVFTYFASRVWAGQRSIRKQPAAGNRSALAGHQPREAMMPGTRAGWLWSRARQEASNLSLFLFSALVPILGFFAYFSVVLPFVDAAKAVATPWAVLLRTDIPSNRFYVLSMGLDDVGGNALRAAAAAAAVLLVLLVGVLLSFLKTGIKAKFIRSMAAAAVLAAVAYSSPFPVTRALPILVLLALVTIAVRFRRAGFAEGGYRLNSLLLWGVFSACLLAKMLLNARIHHYGFYLSLPSIVLLLGILFHTVPLAVRKRGGDWRFFRLWALAILAVFVGHYFMLSRAIYQGKNHPFGRGLDTILAFNPQLDPRVLPTTRALEWLSSRLQPEETFVVLPEGVMLNYQAKRLNPTRHISFTYPEILAHGEDRILKDLIERPPNYIVVIQRDVREYGIDDFGDDPRYGKKIMSWVEEAYAPCQAFGTVPFEKGNFGLRILKRTTP